MSKPGAFDEVAMGHHALLFRKPAPAAPRPWIVARPAQAPAPVAEQRHRFVALDLEAPPPPPPEPVHDPLPALLEAARDEGFAAGLAAAQQAAAAAREEAALMALQAVADGMIDARHAARAEAEIAAAAIAETALAAIGAALPSLARQCAAAEVEIFTAALLPLMVTEPSLRLSVSPEVAEALAERFAAQPLVTVSADPALSGGDAVLRWQGGQATRRDDATRQAVAQALAACGLNT